MVQIRNIEDLLGLKRDQILTYTAKPLLSTGENYGSTMLAVDVKITEEENKRETAEYHYVAKMTPPSDFLKELFNTPATFKQEMAVYTEIVPLLQQFQRKHKVTEVMDFFSKLVSSRLSLDKNSDEVDDDAVMLFVNLKREGFEVVDRFKGFDLECTELLLADLATFHAVSLAFKLENPEDFKTKIRVHFQSFKFNMSEENRQNIIDSVIKIAERDEECASYIENVKTAFDVSMSHLHNKPEAREPFATITHNDYWVNNTMVKFVNDKPVKNVMVDFQIIDYGSPADDLLFFLYSSVNADVLEKHYDTLINYYYSKFINILKDLKCNTDLFAFELFEEELKMASLLQFAHILFMLLPIFTKRGAVKELPELKEEDFVQDDQLAEEFPRKLLSVIRDYGKRGWI